METQNETWKDCEGFAGVQVSNLGHVKVGGWRIPSYNDNGYRKVILDDKNIRVHRLVAAAFCLKPNGCDIVNHLDGSRDNNHASNLEWTTVKGNAIHAVETGLLPTGENHNRTELTEALVLRIDALLRADVSNGDIAAQTGVSREVVSKIKAGRTWAKVTGRELVTLIRKKSEAKSKLTAEQVVAIRQRVAAGESRRSIAKELGMSHTSIMALVNGDTWK